MSTVNTPHTSISRRRNFDDDLKLQVVRLVREQKLSVVEVCRDFNISSSSLHRWLNQYDAERDGRAGSGAPNRAWVCDITYMRTDTGWLYLPAVLDLYSRKIVGWATDNAMPANLVCTALQRAIAQRRPPPGLIVHRDRGSQYASGQHRQLLAQHDLIASMSRKGNCWDNAVMERFFLNLKMSHQDCPLKIDHYNT